MTDKDPDSEQELLRAQAYQLGTQVKAAIAAIFECLAERRIRDQKSLQATLQLSQTAVSRLLSTVRSVDPLAVLTTVPGIDVVRQLLDGATAATLPDELIEALREAIALLEDFIHSFVGDRIVYDAILSELVPEARAAFEVRHRALAFKSMSVLKGVRADLCMASVVVVPAADGRTVEMVGLDILHRCRRLKPSGVLRTNTSVMRTAPQDFTLTTLQGTIPTALVDLLLPGFSTIDDEQVRTTQHDAFSDTSVEGLPLIQAGAAVGHDIVTAQVLRGIRRTRQGSGRYISIGGTVDPPCEEFIVDAWLHEEVWPGIHPEATVFDTVIRGQVTAVDDPARLPDKLVVMEPVHYIGRGLDGAAIAEYPRYGELMAFTTKAHDVDLTRLRGYRFRIRYPIYGSQIQLSFTVPE